MGMKNHEVVPLELALKISRGRRSSSSFLRLFKDQLVPNGLLAFDKDVRHCFQGYRLTNLGYDYLALHQLFKSEQLCDLGSMVGAGKESDVYIATAGQMCGRLVDGSSSIFEENLPNAGEAALFKHGVSVPVPLSQNRNAVVMSYVEDSVPLYRVLPEFLRQNNSALAKVLYSQAKHILATIVSVGLIHGDFNEFNLMVSGLNTSSSVIDDDFLSSVKLVIIDFPQMISRDHKIANEIYFRDLDGINSFFSRYFEIPYSDLLPESIDDLKRSDYLDVVHQVPGYIGSKNSRRNVRTTSKDFLIGSVTRLKLAQDDSDSYDLISEHSNQTDDETDSLENKHEDDTHSEGGSHTNDDCDDEEGQCEKENFTECRITTEKPVRSTKNKPSSGSIDLVDIREIRKRELKQQRQAEFQRRLKRNNRAKTKRKARNDLNSELLLFM